MNHSLPATINNNNSNNINKRTRKPCSNCINSKVACDQGRPCGRCIFLSFFHSFLFFNSLSVPFWFFIFSILFSLFLYHPFTLYFATLIVLCVVHYISLTFIIIINCAFCHVFFNHVIYHSCMIGIWRD